MVTIIFIKLGNTECRMCLLTFLQSSLKILATIFFYCALSNSIYEVGYSFLRDYLWHENELFRNFTQYKSGNQESIVFVVEHRYVCLHAHKLQKVKKCLVKNKCCASFSQFSDLVTWVAFLFDRMQKYIYFTYLFQ